MANRHKFCNRMYALSLPAALMFYGIPGLLVACVVSGVWVFTWLICRSVRENRQKRAAAQEKE